MKDAFQAAYIETNRSGLLSDKIQAAYHILKTCTLCPRQCRVDRLDSDERGVCNTGKFAWVSSCHPHFGEEAPLVGSHGSGTIFFTHCNLLCNFCQNFDISHEGVGEPVADHQLADMMMSLQQAGCHNINFVTPSHVVPQILSAVKIAADSGLTSPLVYNSSGYDRVSTLQLLADVIDIYMPDFKFWEPDVADRTCCAPDYPKTARRAITEMHRQVGDLVINRDGIAQRGVLIRHLVLPGGLAGTRDIMQFIFKKISPHSYVNIMPQYRPCGRAHEIKELAKPLTDGEFNQALKAAKTEGITRLDRPRRTFVIWP
jgi:putative pyruvate formate lyase activating enzyme